METEQNQHLFKAKQFLRESSRVTPKPKRGYAIWIEWGKWYTAKKVNPKKFGEHAYAGGYGLGHCDCGCEMGQSSSSGPVDPFGACPLNPLSPRARRSA